MRPTVAFAFIRLARVQVGDGSSQFVVSNDENDLYCADILRVATATSVLLDNDLHMFLSVLHGFQSAAYHPSKMNYNIQCMSLRMKRFSYPLRIKWFASPTIGSIQLSSATHSGFLSRSYQIRLIPLSKSPNRGAQFLR